MIEDVREFNVATGIDEVPLSGDQLFAIVAEEVAELGVALKENNPVEIADAVGDILFATISCAERIGLPTQAIFDEVVRSNMTKVGGPIIDGKLRKPDTFEEPDFAKVLGLEE